VRYLAASISFALFLVFLSPAWANECRMARLTQVTYQEDLFGGVLVPVTIGGKKALMELDSGGGHSAISDSLAKELGIERKQFSPDAGVMFQDGANRSLLDYGRVMSFEIGSLKYAKPMDFLIIPDLPRNPGEAHIRGFIGLNILRGYNVEIDFARKKLGFYAKRVCPGKVVYWARDWVEIPLKVDEFHSIVTVTLDGKEVEAFVDTGADASMLSLDLATSLFGITKKSPGLKKDAEVIAMSGATLQSYTYTFQSLDIHGIAIEKPVVHLLEIEGKMAETFILGIDLLRKFRLFFAYSENKIYATPANAGLETVGE
jgi:predicted aspartyl protease